MVIASLNSENISVFAFSYSREKFSAQTKRPLFPDYGGSLLQKAWILPQLPFRDDKVVCGWQAKQFQFPAKNPYRKFEQTAKSEIISMR